MPDLGGFEVVGELTVGVLNQILQGAWDNNVIPHSVPIAPGTAFGPYQIADGVVNIPRSGVHLVMDPPTNGVRVTLASEIQVHVANPPIPSAAFFDMQADVSARVPIGVLPGTIKVAALLEGLPRGNVSATVTSGDPIPPLTLTAIEEFVHAKYRDSTIPHDFSQDGVGLGGVTADVWVDIYDDPSKPTHRITVSQPSANKVKVLIPIHLKLSNLSAGLTPAGVVAKISLLCDLEVIPGRITAKLATAVVDLEDYGPAPASDAAGDHDNEGPNYTQDNAFSGNLLETVVKQRIKDRGQAIATAIGDIVVIVPTLAQIETFIADRAHAALLGRGNIGLWTPTPPPGGGVSVTDVKPVALADAIAFCLNNPAGNTGAIVNFIPPARTCAIAISAAKVLQIIDQQIHRPESEGGFGPDFPPHTFSNVDGHDAKLTKLEISLIPGSIHLEGEVTVIDAIADSIDVDADFEAEVGLQWQDNPDGTQKVQPFTISDDVDLSLLAWIVSFLLGFISFGLVGGIIALVVIAIVEGIAERIGGSVIRDDVTGQVKGIGAWPQQLEGIGEVTSRFENPILIDSQGILFGDAYQVVATFASVADALAQANGPYTVPEGAEVQFLGGPIKPQTDYHWDFGDGASANAAVVTHRYADDGLYVAKLTTKVNVPGGVTTRHFAAVRVTNVPATVDAGLPLTIDEGQEVEYVATFTDPGWPDTHTATFDFGDDSTPVAGTVTETNAPPLGTGTARAKHAYCDNGNYIVTVRILDDDGGFGVGKRQVKVLNVAPTVDAGDDLFAYPCTPITMVGRFTDPGWCDTHTGTWDFGDCTPPVPATVRERNEPPEGCGIVAATHVYHCCGAFHAVCTVVDDDGGVGRDAIVVSVVDVRNKDFEEGFHTRPLGQVANHWEPYPSAGSAGAEFAADQFVVHGGQRSQRVASAGKAPAGIYQIIGANLGWDYQVTAWYHIEAGAAAVCRLGIDPAGGVDPQASSIVWSEGSDAGDWFQLTVRVTATARAVGVFLEVEAQQRGGSAFFDDVLLLPYPCPLGEAPPCKPPTQAEHCVDWRSQQRPTILAPAFEQGGFTFESLSGEPLQIVVWGAPAGEGKLALPRKALRVTLPFVGDRVVAHVETGTREPVRMDALSATNAPLGTVSGSGATGVVEMLEQRANGIHTLLFTGGGGEGLLIDICCYRDDTKQSDNATPNEAAR